MYNVLPRNIKKLLDEYGGTHIGIADKLHNMVRDGIIYKYSIYQSSIFVYGEHCNCVDFYPSVIWRGNNLVCTEPRIIE